MGPTNRTPIQQSAVPDQGVDALEIPATPRQDSLQTAVEEETLHGLAFSLQETGSESLLWAVQLDEEPGFHGVRTIGAGDILTIKSPGGEVLFQGVVDPDYKTGSTLRGEFEERRVIPALNNFVHWSQRGWAPDQWAKLFLDETNRAELRQASYDSIKET